MSKSFADYIYFRNFVGNREYGRISHDLCDDFRAYGAYLRNLVNNLKASKMNTLALTFAICLVPATAFLIWLFTPWGKKWSKEL